MPIFKSQAGGSPCDIFYDIKGELESVDHNKEKQDRNPCSSGRPDVVLIMGFGATHGCWEPQLSEGLLTGRHGGKDPKCRILMMDNRGVGSSGCPEDKRQYTTAIMAQDVLNLLDYISWGKVHVVGHSMGAMVAGKLASLAPSRVCSLTLISPSGGGWQAVPRSLTAFWLCLKAVLTKSPEVRAEVDVQLHFNRRMLNSVDDRYGRTRKELLHESYLEGSKGGGPGQPQHGFRGQLNAVWTHSLSESEASSIREANVPTMVIHGRHDIMAAPSNGELLASRLHAPFMMLDGAHMLCRERGPEINQLLHIMIFHGRRLRDTQHRFLLDEPEDTSISPADAQRSKNDSEHQTQQQHRLTEPVIAPEQQPPKLTFVHASGV